MGGKQAWTGFKPMTSVIPVQCSTNWAMKPTRRKLVTLWVRYIPEDGKVDTKHIIIVERLKHERLLFLLLCNVRIITNWFISACQMLYFTVVKLNSKINKQETVCWTSVTQNPKQIFLATQIVSTPSKSFVIVKDLNVKMFSFTVLGATVVVFNVIS